MHKELCSRATRDKACKFCVTSSQNPQVGVVFVELLTEGDARVHSHWLLHCSSSEDHDFAKDVVRRQKGVSGQEFLCSCLLELADSQVGAKLALAGLQG